MMQGFCSPYLAVRTIDKAIIVILQPLSRKELLPNRLITVWVISKCFITAVLSIRIIQFA